MTEFWQAVIGVWDAWGSYLQICGAVGTVLLIVALFKMKWERGKFWSTLWHTIVHFRVWDPIFHSKTDAEIEAEDLARRRGLIKRRKPGQMTDFE